MAKILFINRKTYQLPLVLKVRKVTEATNLIYLMGS